MRLPIKGVDVRASQSSRRVLGMPQRQRDMVIPIGLWMTAMES